MAKRGSAISVPESWLERCRRWREEEGLTVEAAGARLARVARRGRPFADATVRRYLKGSVVTDELTQAFAKAMGAPIPVVIHNEQHREWYEVGAELEEIHPNLFQAELDRLKQILAMAKALRELDSDL